MSEVACNVIKTKIANLLSERTNMSVRLMEIDAKIDGMRDALEAFERNERKETPSAPKVKRAYKRRMKRADGPEPSVETAPSTAHPAMAMPATAEPSQAVA